MDILIINHYAGSPYHGMEYRPFYLAREWVKKGHRVIILASSVSHVRTNSPKLTSREKIEEIDGIKYIWLKTLRYQGNNIRRALNMLSFVAKVFRCYRSWPPDFHPDLVIASSTYPLDNFPAYYLARRFKARFIYEVHDLWPLSAIELGNMPKWHPFILLMQWAEDFAYHKADCVISLLPKAESHMRKHGLAPGKFIYIPNGIDIEEWNHCDAALPDVHDQALRRLRAGAQFIVGYVGAHGVANALHLILEAAWYLRDRSVSILFVGTGPEKVNLQRLAVEKGLNHVEFLPSVPKECVPGLLSKLDALIITLKPISLFRFGISPNKLMDYMMAGKPIIQAIDAGNDIVGECDCGISIRQVEPTAIAQAILKIMSMNQKERLAQGLRGKEYVRKNYDYAILSDRFINACLKTAGKHLGRQSGLKGKVPPS